MAVERTTRRPAVVFVPPPVPPDPAARQWAQSWEASMRRLVSEINEALEKKADKEPEP